MSDWPPSDVDLAHLSMTAYLPGHSQIEIGSDLSASITDYGNGVVVAFRGTSNIAGWIRDFDALPASHDLLGRCHSGFLRGASQLWNKFNLPAGSAVILTGHSLGGALAVLTGALRVVAQERVDSIVTFGCPRAAYAKVSDVLTPVAVRQYRRGRDPVTNVPFDLPAFPYKHAREPLIALGKPDADPLDDHSIMGYIEDIASMFTEVAK